eukprot:6210743-Pleurochrysis_carterae.AAC.1
MSYIALLCPMSLNLLQLRCSAFTSFSGVRQLKLRTTGSSSSASQARTLADHTVVDLFMYTCRCRQYRVPLRWRYCGRHQYGAPLRPWRYERAA